MRTIVVGALSGLLLAGLLVGCGQQSVPEEGAKQLAEQLLPTTSESQRAMLEDLAVTRQEYELAHEHFFDCMAERGWNGQPELSLDGITFDLAFTGPVTDRAQADVDVRECENEYLKDVAVVYVTGLAVPEGQVSAVKDELMLCLESAGVTGVDREWNDGELADYLEETNATQDAWNCREAALTKLGSER